jgi:hypothetical protein
MAGKNTAVFGIYSNYAEAERAVSALQAAGFRNTDISVLFPENEGTKDFAHEKGTKAPEGAATGAGTGAAVGATMGWLAGIGALAIPGLGPFIAAGPIMAALAGAGVGGAVGGLTGALIGMGIPEYEAKRYEGRVKKGGILLSVHSDNSDWTRRAKKVLEDTGAEDISSTGETKGDFANADRPMPRAGSTSDSALREGIRETDRGVERERMRAREESIDAIIVEDPLSRPTGPKTFTRDE